MCAQVQTTALRSGRCVRACASKAGTGSGKAEPGHIARAHSRIASAGSQAQASLTWLQANFPQITAVAGAGIVIYSMSRLASWTMGLSLTDAASLGFGAGFMAAGSSAAIIWAISSALRIRPDRVFRHALRKVQAHEATQAMLGLHISAGNLRAYTLRQGYLSLCPTTSRPVWVEPRVQMLFQVQGDFAKGMVTVEAKKHFPNRLEYALVTVDPLGPKGHMQLVEGDAERLHVRGQLREFLQSERVEYIDQTAVDEDEAADVQGQWEPERR